MKKTSQRSSAKAERTGRALARENQHDTPPTLTFNDGSFEIESKQKLNEGGTGPWFYTASVGETTIEHIRVIHGSGEMVYQNLDAHGSTIILELKKNGEASVLNTLIITGDENALTIKSGRQLAAAEKSKAGASSREFILERMMMNFASNESELRTQVIPSKLNQQDT